MEIRLSLPIPAYTFDRLRSLAQRDFRTPKQQAVALLVEAVEQAIARASSDCGPGIGGDHAA